MPAATDDNAEPTLAELMKERIQLRRKVRALTAGNAWLVKAGEVCSRMGMRSWQIADAIHHTRRHFLPERYHDMPLSDVERTLHRQGMNALVICILYEVMAPAIMRQLDTMKREIEADPAAAERYAKGPTFIHGTLSVWPGRGAARRAVT